MLKEGFVEAAAGHPPCLPRTHGPASTNVLHARPPLPPAEGASVRPCRGRSSGTLVGMEQAAVSLRQVVLDCTDARKPAEFYRRLLGYQYRPGDDPPPAGEDDPNRRDWLVLRGPAGGSRQAFRQVAELPDATWPDGPRPQMAHLGLTRADDRRARGRSPPCGYSGARLLRDRSDDPDEPLRVYADPAEHPFCIFVADPPSA